LLEEHRTLQTKFDDTVSEKEDAIARLNAASREVGAKRNDRGDVMLKTEIDRLRAEL
jgi:protein HOOK3